MNINFFEWLRDSVRQSVLLGVSDAVDEIGTPPNSDELKPKFAAMLGADEKAKPKSNARGGGRKRLGKSLKEMDTAPLK